MGFFMLNKDGTERKPTIRDWAFIIFGFSIFIIWVWNGLIILVLTSATTDPITGGRIFGSLLGYTVILAGFWIPIMLYESFKHEAEMDYLMKKTRLHFDKGRESHGM